MPTTRMKIRDALPTMKIIVLIAARGAGGGRGAGGAGGGGGVAGAGAGGGVRGVAAREALALRPEHHPLLPPRDALLLDIYLIIHCW